MAGLNFYTQTIINANVDKDSNDKVLFEAKDDVLHIKRDFVFEKNNVKAIRKRAGYEPEMCKAVIDFGAIAEIKPTTEEPKKYCRLDLYLGVEGAEPFIYSTPWVQKGMPFWVEFTVSSKNASAIAEHVADMIKKNNLFQVDKDLLKVTVDKDNKNKLILEGATEFQRFRNIEVNVFAAADDYADRVASMKDGDFDANFVRGKNGFGTYSQIVKDLRLPTAENYQWTHIRQSETPIVGAVYNQYIIEYCAPASNEGLGAVGQRLESWTTHVFWVKNDSELISEWETALKALRDIEDVQDEINARNENPSGEEPSENALDD